MRNCRQAKKGRRLLRALQLNEPNDLIRWVQTARKEAVAGLASEVFGAWAQGDSLAASLVAEAAHDLAAQAATAAQQLAGPAGPVEFLLAGGLLLRQPRFARLVRRQLRALRPGARATLLARESAWGAVVWARQAYGLAVKPASGTSRCLAPEASRQEPPRQRA